jgi:trimeric autotransporter adhesin
MIGFPPFGFLRSTKAQVLPGELLPFNPNIEFGQDGTRLRSMVLAGNILYLGGQFTSVGGVTRNKIAAVDATTGAVLPFNPNSSSFMSVITSMDLAGNILYIGGTILNIGDPAVTRRQVAALDVTTGAVLPFQTLPPDGGFVSSIAISSSTNTLFVGGNFNSIDGQTRLRLASLNATTGSVLPWDPSPNFSVNTLLISDNTLYVGGAFTTINGQARNRVAAFDIATGSLLPFNPNFATSGAIIAMSISTDKNSLFLAGSFNQRLVSVNPVTGAVLPPGPFGNLNTFPSTTNANVTALAFSDGKIYAGGQFTSAHSQQTGSLDRERLAAFNGLTGNLLIWAPNVNSVSNAIDSIIIGGDKAYIGGSFTTINGQARNRVAAITI